MIANTNCTIREVLNDPSADLEVTGFRRRADWVHEPNDLARGMAGAYKPPCLRGEPEALLPG